MKVNTNSMSKIVVIGSSNTDLIAKVNEFPKVGETIKGISYLQVMGGKGANQAIAAHRLGGDVRFITSLGNDSNGLNTLEYFKQKGLIHHYLLWFIIHLRVWK